MLLFLPAIFLLFSAGASVRGAGEKMVVRVSAEAVVASDRISLGDIAQIQSGEASSAIRLASIALGYAPNVGAVREVERDRIILALTAAGFPPGKINLEAPAVTLVRRAAQIVDPQVVREAVERVALTDIVAQGATAARLVKLDLPAVIEVPSGTLDARAALGGVRDLFAPFVVAIELRVDGRVARRLSVTAQIEARAAIVVALRDLTADARVRDTDVKVEERLLTRPHALYLRDARRLRGTALRRSVARGEAITTDLLAAQIIVKPGDPVRIVCESGSLHVAVAGQAQAAGRVGDRIQVKNIQSGMLIQTVVVDEGVVHVRF